MIHKNGFAERRVNGHRLNLPTYGEFVKAHKEAKVLALPDRCTRISNGRVGPKILGVAFILHALEQGYPLAGDQTHRIVVPKSWAVGTDTDKEFLEKNKLHGWLGDRGMWPLSSYARNYSGRWTEAERVYFERVVPKFLSSELPEPIMRALFEVAKSPWPKAVRSAHDLEDNPNQMMAGKYYSTFTANSGSDLENLRALSDDVKRVLASSFNPDAVAFMDRHDLLSSDTNMSVLIMDVFGKKIGERFAPDVSGVVFTRNFVPWCEKIKVEDPVARLVYGMATRAVASGSYARELSLSAPNMRPQVNPGDIMAISQERFDAINLRSGKIMEYLLEVAARDDAETLAKICSVIARNEPDFLMAASLFTLDPEQYTPFVTFDSFSKNERKPGGVLDMIMRVSRGLEPLFYGKKTELYDRGLDWEGGFSLKDGKTGIWQVRPMGHRPEHRNVKFPENVPSDSTVLYTKRVLGNGEVKTPHIVFVPEGYCGHSHNANEVVRAIGALDRKIEAGGETYILITPGRLGSSHSDLGVPVKYQDIRNAKVIVEYPTSKVTPDLSSATHFLNEFFGGGGIYLAPNSHESTFNEDWLRSSQSLPTGSEVVKHIFDPNGFIVKADGRSQRGIIYFR